MRIWRIARELSFALALLSLANCGLLKKKQPQAEPVPTTTPTVALPAPPAPAATTAPVATASVAVPDEAIPAPEDFEDEAFTKVSDKSYKTELDSLKKELDAQ